MNAKMIRLICLLPAYLVFISFTIIPHHHHATPEEARQHHLAEHLAHHHHHVPHPGHGHMAHFVHSPDVCSSIIVPGHKWVPRKVFKSFKALHLLEYQVTPLAYSNRSAGYSPESPPIKPDHFHFSFSLRGPPSFAELV